MKKPNKLYLYLDETVTLASSDIIHVKRVRNLGFQVDANLKGDSHVNYLSCTLFITSVMRLHNYLDQNSTEI